MRLIDDEREKIREWHEDAEDCPDIGVKRELTECLSGATMCTQSHTG